jgi:3-mercaptopropionate dioxygenase
MIHSLSSLAPLHSAITALQCLCDSEPNESDWLAEGKRIVQQLLIDDAWLPDSHAASHPQYYQQHALHIDAANRFSLSSFVWGPNQGTPVHNHTIAGLVGVLRGAEMCQRYSDDGSRKIGKECRLNPGDIDVVSPTIGDVHTVRNAYDDRNSISIHLYRGNIAGTPRNVFKDGEKRPFVSSYSSAAVLA